MSPELEKAIITFLEDASAVVKAFIEAFKAEAEEMADRTSGSRGR